MKHVRIYLTEKCNASCPWCFNKSSRNNQNMDTEKCKKFLSYCAKNNVKSLGIFGGEPTVHPDFIEIWNYAYPLFDEITLYTNGLNRAVLSQIPLSENKRLNVNFYHLNHIDPKWLKQSSLSTEVVIGENTNADALLDKIKRIYKEVQEVNGSVFFNLTIDCTLNIFKHKDAVLPQFDKILDFALANPDYKCGVDHKYPKCCLPESMVKKIHALCGGGIGNNKELFLCNPIERKTPLITSDFKARTCPQYDGNSIDVFKEDGSIIPFTQLSNFIAFEIIDRLKSLKNTSCAMCDYFMSECNGGCFSYKFKH